MKSPTLPDKARKLTLNAQLQGAATSTLSGAAPVSKKQPITGSQEGDDLLNMCMVFGLEALPPRSFTKTTLVALCVACMDLIGSPRPTDAQAAAAGCRVAFVPERRLSGRKRARVVARAHRRLRTSCKSTADGRLSLTITAGRKAPPLRKLIGSKLRIGLVRGQPLSGSDGPSPQMVLRWGR